MTAEPGTSRPEVERLSVFWRFIGLSVVEMSAHDHDRALAQTSHVPHVVAAALAASLDAGSRHLTAGGFQDTTRIAAGDPRIVDRHSAGKCRGGGGRSPDFFHTTCRSLAGFGNSR